MPRVYQMFGEMLRATGRPIVYAICQYGMADGPKWAAEAGGNLWRTTGDIRETWASVAQIGFSQNGLEVHAGPGRWNDPDMLEVGNGDLTLDENRAHFSLWSILAAPLLTGNDLTAMKPEIREILLNREVIAVNQDRLGRQGKRILKNGDVEIWAKELSGGDWAIGVFNLGQSPAEVRVEWSSLGLKGVWKVRDLWGHADLGTQPQGYSAAVAPHGVSMVRLTQR
jgi:alpha-galactosidase